MRVQINRAAVNARIQAAINAGLAQLSSEILDDMNEYCKEAEGYLIASSYDHSRPEEGRLVWQTEYARRQYYEIRTAYKDVNPNASWKWCEVARTHHAGEWERKARALIHL